MNTVDTLFSNIGIVCLIVATLFWGVALTIAAVNRHADIGTLHPFKQIALLQFRLVVMSGKMQLLFLLGYMIMAGLFNMVGLPKTAMVTVALGVFNLIAFTSSYMVNISLHRNPSLG